MLRPEYVGWQIAGALLIVLSLTLAALVHVRSETRLVGYGCEGAGGPLYAKEESDFPKCERIERR